MKKILGEMKTTELSVKRRDQLSIFGSLRSIAVFFRNLGFSENFLTFWQNFSKKRRIFSKILSR